MLGVGALRSSSDKMKAYQEVKEVSSRKIFFLVKLERPVCYFEMGPSSFSLHWRKLSSGPG